MKRTIHTCDLCQGAIGERYAQLVLPQGWGKPPAKPDNSTDDANPFAFRLFWRQAGDDDGPRMDICEPCVRLLLDHAKAHAEALQ